ncbi:MAG: hypothetical protein WC358_06725 [Ignavibacteria bacterium]|jgi:hypothetical protein
MKRYNVGDLKNAILESSATRHNILTILESETPPEPYVIGRWKGYSITLPDGVELTTKRGMKIAGAGYKVKVYNKDGQYTAYMTDHGDLETPIELTYVINEAHGQVIDIVVYD